MTSGTISESFTNFNDELRTEMLITRESADDLWRVLRVDDQASCARYVCEKGQHR